MKIALCQLNPVTGDIRGNTARITETLTQYSNQTIDLFIFPELFIAGYPPLDLLENNWFIARGLAALDELCQLSLRYPDTGILTGVPLPDYVAGGRGLFNAAVLIYNGTILFHQNKSLLPTYDVFDESRYFDPAPTTDVVPFKGELLGVTVCEDAWNINALGGSPRYAFDPVTKLADSDATLLINISASPFHRGKIAERTSLFQEHARKHTLPFICVNMVGANDELIFDGSSIYVDQTGTLRTLLPSFQEEVRVIDTYAADAPAVSIPSTDSIADVYQALVLGVKDYTRKCGFTRACIGLSGGIDSAVTAAIAVAALGPKNVFGVTMPSQYSSGGSVTDSETLAAALGMTIQQIPIEPIYSSYMQSLTSHFNGRKPDSTEENIQARIRGTVLMSLSNKFGCLLLTTGNKSELAVGYCTLYGDMCGGLAVISDCYKMLVYDLARYINREREIIPDATITKPPSAELRPGQKDADTLPPYDILDAILKAFIEEGAGVKDIIAKGFNPDTVRWVANAVSRNEYKRRQAAPGLKISPKAFGYGRRFPVAAKYER